MGRTVINAQNRRGSRSEAFGLLLVNVILRPPGRLFLLFYDSFN